MEMRTCSCCGKTFPETTEYFYRHKASKKGLNTRCKFCVNAQNKAYFEKRKKEFPELIKQLQRKRSAKYYYKDVEKSRKISREYARKMRNDPEKLAKIKARKRGGGAGLTIEELDALYKKQNNKCFICGEPNPTDLDHDHKTGKIRFLLCKHCNRGLGAFKDNPELLRKAAKALEDFYGN